VRIASGIRCAGEVRVSQHEEYDKWAIDILVKFRDHENLQLLTGQRQSGGVSTFVLGQLCRLNVVVLLQERSLTTILYLMSLTEEARAPFSLVDEINQVCAFIRPG
jgi:predicted methyltransferase MtxX (methanogen marker protein 4)